MYTIKHYAFFLAVFLLWGCASSSDDFPEIHCDGDTDSSIDGDGSEYPDVLCDGDEVPDGDTGTDGDTDGSEYPEVVCDGDDDSATDGDGETDTDDDPETPPLAAGDPNCAEPAPPAKQKAGVALTFDDDYVDAWYAHRHIFDAHNVKATFFITRFHLLTQEQIEKLQELKADGHEMGCHTVNHPYARDYIDEHGLEAYLQNEILPAIESMRAHGLEPTVFSFPRGSRTPELIEELLKLFTTLRTSGTIAGDDRIYYKWDPVRLVYSGCIDDALANQEQILLALDKAKTLDSVVTLYAHDIADETDHYFVKPGTLEATIQAAVDRGLSFYTVGELGQKAIVRKTGPEIIYHFLDEGEGDYIQNADMILEDTWYTSPRVPPAHLPWPLTWTEDPYEDNYWRFLFYSLRPTANLLAAYRETLDDRYTDKLIDVFQSMADTGLDSTHVNDKHGSAFLAMVAANSYCKLKRWGKLDTQTDSDIRKIMVNRGHFLSDSAHFEKNNNHGVTQAAALMLLGHLMRDSELGDAWKGLGIERMEEVVRRNVDDSGVQIEQSPFYHFYVLNFFWQIFHWDHRFDVWASQGFDATIDKMIRFATYITLPNGDIPLIGSSTQYPMRKKFPDLYSQIAEYDPGFAWIWSAGRLGAPPAQSSAHFPEGGWVILKSSFGTPENFADPTQVIFDIGPYRTSHSHLDALSVFLYAHGQALLVDSGLHTYDAGTEKSYFFGTSAHNTITVDGKDQEKGTGKLGSFIETDGYRYTSGSHTLYSGVTHRRGVLMVGQDLVVVLDDIGPDSGGGSVKEYTQHWHVHPSLNLSLDGLTASIEDDHSRLLTIHQALPGNLSVTSVKGQDDPYKGWYSEAYQTSMPKWEMSYTTEGQRADFVTVFALGDLATQTPTLQAEREGGTVTLTLEFDAMSAEITVSDLAGEEENISVYISP